MSIEVANESGMDVDETSTQDFDHEIVWLAFKRGRPWALPNVPSITKSDDETRI